MTDRLIFFDLETAGIDPKRHPIIQVAAIAIDAHAEVLEAYEAKLRFDTKRAKAYSLRKANYRRGVWANEALTPREAAADFAAFVRRHACHAQLSASGSPYQVAQLVAHNAAFDGPFLCRWFESAGVYLPARKLILCTMQLAMWRAAQGLDAPPPNFQLASLCRHYGVPFHASAAHDALGDVTATVQLYRAITTLDKGAIAGPPAHVRHKNQRLVKWRKQHE